jgi:hypothetical protein
VRRRERVHGVGRVQRGGRVRGDGRRVSGDAIVAGDAATRRGVRRGAGAGGLSARLRRAAGLVKRGNAAHKAKKVKQLVMSALKQVTRGEQAAGKATGHLSAACHARLVDRFAEAVSRVQCLLARL